MTKETEPMKPFCKCFKCGEMTHAHVNPDYLLSMFGDRDSSDTLPMNDLKATMQFICHLCNHRWGVNIEVYS